MPCTNPRTVYQQVTGGKPKFKKPKEEGFFPMQIPCNECLSCLQRHAMDWATRQYCEMVTNLSIGIGFDFFITNTYAPEHLPAFGHYDYSDMQGFWKRVRSKQEYEAKKVGIEPEQIKFKYISSPEYGDRTQRPHFHSNTINLWIPDLKKAGKNEHGNPVMRSEMLESCWNKGIIDIQPFGVGSARYLANHNIKQNGTSVKKHMKMAYYAKRKALAEIQNTDNPFCIETGLILPEKMPLPRIYCSGGIGLDYLKKYKQEIYNNGFITVNGLKNPPPRYFDKKLREIDPQLWLKVMQERKENQRVYTDKELQSIGESKLNKKRFFSKAGKL